jgi:dihydrofolate synthase / folylpolyglutamate synthase
MNYQQTINHLFTRLPMFSRIGAAAYKKDLGNTLQLCAILDNPQHKFKSIHIAGTNGKGSVSHALAAILQTAGYKTGLYTSPHLSDFRERIKINGVMIPEAVVVEFVQQIQSSIETIEPSFFEITVAMAFDFFAKEKVDIAVIETGLGGRLDSTNVITPELSVITNISMDHTDLLGNTRAAIAGEKAGIIKPGVPVVIGERHPETDPVFEQKALHENASLFFATDLFSVQQFTATPAFATITVQQTATNTTAHYQPDLNGSYQQHNLLTVLAAVEQLRKAGYLMPAEAVTTALQNVKQLTGLHGRWEVMRTQPLIILDVAHNEAGIRALVQQLHEMQQRTVSDGRTGFKQLHIVFGMVKDKDASTILALLPRHAVYHFTKAAIPRALPENELAAKAAAHQLKGKTYPTVNEAVTSAMAMLEPEDALLICGSVFIVGEVNRALFGGLKKEV